MYFNTTWFYFYKLAKNCITVNAQFMLTKLVNIRKMSSFKLSSPWFRLSEESVFITMFRSFMFSPICSLGKGKLTKLALKRLQLEVNSVDVSLELTISVEFLLAVWTDSGAGVMQQCGP